MAFIVFQLDLRRNSSDDWKSLASIKVFTYGATVWFQRLLEEGSKTEVEHFNTKRADRPGVFRAALLDYWENR